MAYRNKLIRNRKTGHEILFLHTAQNTDGRFLGMIVTLQPQQQPEALRYHPQQTLEFDVLTGALTVLLDDKLTYLQQGDKLQIGTNQLYTFWNKSSKPTIINCRLRPALNTEHLLETVTGLANNQATPVMGLVSLLQNVLIAREFSHVFRRASVPYLLQQAIMTLLTPFAYLAGYRSTYKEYLD